MQICHRAQIHQGSNNNRSRNRSRSSSSRSLGQFQFQFQLQILFFWLLFLGAIKRQRAAIMQQQQQQQLSLNSTKRIVQKLIATFWWSTGSSSSSNHNQFKWISVEAVAQSAGDLRQWEAAAAFLEQFIGFIVVAAVPKGHSDEGEGVCAASAASLLTSSSIAAKVRDICKTSAVQRQKAEQSRAEQGGSAE